MQPPFIENGNRSQSEGILRLGTQFHPLVCLSHADRYSQILWTNSCYQLWQIRARKIGDLLTNYG